MGGPTPIVPTGTCIISEKQSVAAIFFPRRSRYEQSSESSLPHADNYAFSHVHPLPWRTSWERYVAIETTRKHCSDLNLDGSTHRNHQFQLIHAYCGFVVVVIASHRRPCLRWALLSRPSQPTCLGTSNHRTLSTLTGQTIESTRMVEMYLYSHRNDAICLLMYIISPENPDRDPSRAKEIVPLHKPKR